MKNKTWILRIPLVIIFIMHSVPSMFDGGVNAFGTQYLDSQGFAPFGIYVAWLIKLSHVAFALALVLNKYLKPLAWLTIVILLVGIVMVHAVNGWFVVGGGSNAVEYNVLLIAVISYLIFRDSDNQ
jgi:putative oxidoreductase